MAMLVDPPNGIKQQGKHYYSMWQTLFEIDTKYVPIKPIGRGAYGVVCSSVNLEKKNETMGLREKLEIDESPKAETSFTKHGMGLQETEVKPIQKQTATALSTAKRENKNREKDKTCGPAEYGKGEEIELRNRFQQLESKGEELP
ncbi:Uncharacterized protein Rs2_28784 [Raphanus sativus]|nr:Uncharacterized protein Rs2_28784 [Raphanus sativus]